MEFHQPAKQSSHKPHSSFKPFGFENQPSNRRQTKFPRSHDIQRQTQQLRALKLYAMNTQFRKIMLSDYQQHSVQDLLSKYNFYSQTLEKINRKKLKIIKCGKGIVYLGEVFNEKCHGRGIVVFQDGRLYQGQLENNVRQGEGLYVQSDGSWYFGEFSNDKKDGSGLQIHKSYRYKGAYINGLKHGVGFMVTDNIIYSGEWRLGSIHGYGFAQTPQSKYEGTFDKFLKHGQGIQYFRNGDIYKGSYLNGKPEGEGNYTWSDKSTFQGQFKNGKRNGNGIWKSSTGDQYIGNYQNDIKSGQGHFYWKSGNIYKGNFVLDKRDGYGQMYWKDGSHYKGSWSKGIQHGKGQLFIVPNKTYTGIFQNNVLIVEQKPRMRPMTDKESSKKQRMHIMSAVKPQNTYFNVEKQFNTTQKKKSPKPKEPEAIHLMSHHHRNCPACFQKAKRAAENFRIQKVSKSQTRNKSHSYYIPKQLVAHNHSLGESPDDSNFSIGNSRIPSRIQFSRDQPGKMFAPNMKGKSPFRFLKFKFT